jgi:hypothetical protein
VRKSAAEFAASHKPGEERMQSGSADQGVSARYKHAHLHLAPLWLRLLLRTGRCILPGRDIRDAGQMCDLAPGGIAYINVRVLK